MGKLLALSLVTTLAACCCSKPALMGKPRDIGSTADIATVSARVLLLRAAPWSRVDGCRGLRLPSLWFRGAGGLGQSAPCLGSALAHAVSRAGGNRPRDAGPGFAAAEDAQHATLNFKSSPPPGKNRKTGPPFWEKKNPDAPPPEETPLGGGF